MDNEKEYLNVDDVKKITCLSNDSIRKLIRNGEIQASKIGVRYLIKRQDLYDYIERNKKVITKINK